MDELIGGDVEERLVAEEEVENHPGGGGTEDDRAENGRVQIAHHLFECEEDGGDGGVERGGECGGCADGDEILDPGGTEAEAAAERGGDAGAHLHGWSFAAEGDAARKRDGAADELAKDGAEADDAAADE